MEGTLQCPACGHELSMYHAPEMDRGERVAAKVADKVATWWFPATILVLIAAWAIYNIAARPFQPYPVIVLGWIGAVLATIGACQGPLILLSQRRSAQHDRQREEEAFRVAMHAEADIHALQSKVDELHAKLDGLIAAGRPS